MNEHLLQRSDAPFSEAIWNEIDQTVRDTARARLSGRRLLEVVGPFGAGLKSLPGIDGTVDDENGVEVTVDCPTPLAMLSTSFSLSARDIAAFESYGLPMDLSAAMSAAIACAGKEDQLIFHGAKALNATGLLNAPGIHQSKLSPWQEPGQAMEDVLRAIDALDEAGYPGPYTLALSPARFNALFRRYPQGPMTEIDHVRTAVTDGVVKSRVIDDGGVLMAAGKHVASLALGQDLATAFEGPEGRNYTFVVSESLALRLSQPQAVCALKPAK